MTLHAKIRKQLDPWNQLSMHAALHAVLDLHAPEYLYEGDNDPRCVGCSNDVTYVPHDKCETVAVVANELGVVWP